MIILLILISLAATTEILTKEKYLEQLGHKHMFVIACPSYTPECQKKENDFVDEWTKFNQKNQAEFTSAIFLLVKSPENSKFYDIFTSQSTSSLIIYVENSTAGKRKTINPDIMSQRAVKDWLKDLLVSAQKNQMKAPASNTIPLAAGDSNSDGLSKLRTTSVPVQQKTETSADL